MKDPIQQPSAHVTMSGAYWDSLQRNLSDAIVSLDRITGRIAAHEYVDAWTACEVIDYADRQVRAVRKLLEEFVSLI